MCRGLGLPVVDWREVGVRRWAADRAGVEQEMTSFAAGATDLFYRLEFVDVKGGAAKIYFSYPGTPSPAIIDAAAFATCP